MKITALIIISLLYSINTFAQSINVKESKVEFNVMNRGSVVTGTMLNLKGTVNFDKKDLTGSDFTASVAPATVDTKSSGRDKHLQKDDFFGTTEFPLISMQSKEILKTDVGFQAVAELSIRDLKKEVRFPFTVKQEGNKQILEGTVKIQRKDFSLGEKIEEKSIGLEVTVQIYCVVNNE